MDPRHPAFIHVSGIAMNVKQKDATFEIHPRQYISALKEGPSNLDAMGTFPVACTIPDSPWYKGGKKPVPQSNTNMTVSGYLVSVQRDKEGDWVNFFGINVESVDFFGQATVPSGPASTPGQYYCSHQCRPLVLIRYNNAAAAQLKGLTFNFNSVNQEWDDSSDLSEAEPSSSKRRKVDQGTPSALSSKGTAKAERTA
jgi:hypothetical protein